VVLDCAKVTIGSTFCFLQMFNVLQQPEPNLEKNAESAFTNNHW
jgi:hypothetical protein